MTHCARRLAATALRLLGSCPLEVSVPSCYLGTPSNRYLLSMPDLYLCLGSKVSILRKLNRAARLSVCLKCLLLPAVPCRANLPCQSAAATCTVPYIPKRKAVRAHICSKHCPIVSFPHAGPATGNGDGFVPYPPRGPLRLTAFSSFVADSGSGRRALQDDTGGSISVSPIVAATVSQNFLMQNALWGGYYTVAAIWGSLSPINPRILSIGTHCLGCYYNDPAMGTTVADNVTLSVV